MIIERRPLGTLDREDLASWRELASRAAEPNPFYEPAMLLPACRYLNGGAVSMLIVRDGSRWRACLPVHRAARFRKVPGPALLAWVHTHCFLGTPMVERDDPVRALRALLHFAGDDPWAGYLTLELLGDGGPVAAALAVALREEGMRGIVYERAERAALRRRADAAYLNPALRSKRRRELQRQRRALEAELGPIRVENRAGDPRAIEAFLDLETSGWKGAAGTALSAAGHRLFFGELCRTLAADGRLQLLAMDAGDRVVAMKCNILSGDCVFCFKIARDETLDRFSPGVQLELENVDIFHRTPSASWTDSCAWEHNLMINRLWRDRRPVATVLIPGRHALGHASRVAIRAALGARSLMRSRT